MRCLPTQPRAMVVILPHTAPTNVAMLSSHWLYRAAHTTISTTRGLLGNLSSTCTAVT